MQAATDEARLQELTAEAMQLGPKMTPEETWNNSRGKFKKLLQSSCKKIHTYQVKVNYGGLVISVLR